MPKGSPELTEARKNEIIDACEKLYQTMSFKEIILKDISRETTFTRTSIYNYFQTKEEILLALFKREYDRWNEELTELLLKNEYLSREDIADRIAVSLQNRPQLLKLLSMNNYDMEANSRPELLKEFKISYGNSIKTVTQILEKFCPEMKPVEIQNFIYMFFPFMFGIYPYTSVTEKQQTAMKEADIDYTYQSVYEITHTCLLGLLGVKTLPIIGVTKENQVLDAVKAVNVVLTEEETSKLEQTADSFGLNVIRFWEKEMK